MPLPKSGNALYGESSHQSTSHEDLVRHFCQLPVVRTACSKAASAVLTYRRALVSASVLLPLSCSAHLSNSIAVPVMRDCLKHRDLRLIRIDNGVRPD
jgi:hypothetical protein